MKREKTANHAPRLNREWIREHRPADAAVEQAPERIVQFGEGRFLRGFFDWMIHRLNQSGHWQGGIVSIQPTPRGKIVPVLNAQDGLYTVVLEGLREGKSTREVEVVSSIRRGLNPYVEWDQVLKVAEQPEIQWVVSNTTEAGLTYPSEEYSPDTAPLSFPGKLTAFLYRRYQHFSGAPAAGMWILPCELVENNGDVLKELVLKAAADWNLPQAFREWVGEANAFCNTLVDRIVTGSPGNPDEWVEELGYEDQLLTLAELYHFFAVENGKDLKEHLPLDRAGLQVRWGEVDRYRELKLRILNGTHTLLFAPALLSGCDTVSRAMETDWLQRMAKRALQREILPVLEAEESEKQRFAADVLERFANPQLHHHWVDIGQNGASKYRSRLLELLKRWHASDRGVPTLLAFSLAALIRFYKGEMVEAGILRRVLHGREHLMRETPETLTFFVEVWREWDGSPAGLRQLTAKTLQNEGIWGENLCLSIPRLDAQVALHLQRIVEQGVERAFARLMEDET